ncbi:hypothetical protein GT002_29320, partial [Streptomyces sp. SID4917]|nr:hypothetical protein [Streptomyces sp. SID4917]
MPVFPPDTGTGRGSEDHGRYSGLSTGARHTGLHHNCTGAGTSMMGPAHSLSGAAAWLGVGAAAAAAG